MWILIPLIAFLLYIAHRDVSRSTQRYYNDFDTAKSSTITILDNRGVEALSERLHRTYCENIVRPKETVSNYIMNSTQLLTSGKRLPVNQASQDLRWYNTRYLPAYRVT
jgi:hypothetical protein